MWSLDDCLNHLLTFDALSAALRGFAANLARGGIALFDVNTLATYRAFFAEASVVEAEDEVLVWHGMADPGAAAGTVARARFSAFSRTGPDCWRHVALEHVQRHHGEAAVVEALTRAGLECLAVCGQGLDGIPRPGLDELSHTKAVYVARHAR